MLNIKLPREARDDVRALIRNHPAFDAWRAEAGILSRELDKAQSMAAIEALGLESAVHDTIAAAQARALAALSFPVVTAAREAALAAREFNLAEDSRIEAAMQGGDPFKPGRTLDSTMLDYSEAEAAIAGMLESVLNPLRPFLSGTMLATVESALDPIVKLAAKPPVETIVEREIIVTLDKAGKPVAPLAPQFVPAKRIGETSIAKLFGISGRLKHGDKHVSQWDALDAPAIDPFFVPDVGNLARIITALDPKLPRRPRNVWMAGPSGSGKSTLPQQIAARAKRPFLRVAFQRAIEPMDLIGGTGLKGGDTEWCDGMLTRAIRRPGTIILLDEITFAPPGLAAVLQTLLDMGFLTLPTGEVVHCADGVVFCCADNTRGFGDDSGVYAGTQQANAALVDRMARLLVIDYLAPDLEAAALANHTGVPKAACERVVAFCGSARKLAGFDGRPLSLRRQVAFVEQVLDGFTVAESFDDTCLSRLPDAEREALRQHFKAAFDATAFQVEMTGATPVAPVAPASPTQAAAQSAFPVVE